MNSAVITNAIGSLDKLLSGARGALWDIEREVYGDPGYGEPSGYADPAAAMGAILQELHDILLVVLEAADMPETRASLVKAWRGFTGAKGLSHVIHDDEFQNCESPALTFLERLVQGLRITVTEGISSEDAWTLNRLESMLRDTPALVHRSGKTPAGEIDLQRIVHDYLGASFPDFTPNPPIAGSLKHFEPDCGIRSVRAAIEFKFVRAAKDVATAYSGVVEDSAGYKGSNDWTRFYAVIYQAQPFVSESQFRSDLKRVGATTWTAFVVNGPTKEPEKRAKKARGKKTA